MAVQRVNKHQVFSFSPNEICLVLSRVVIPAVGLPYFPVYAGVQEAINRAIAEVAQAGRGQVPQGDDHFQHDFVPAQAGQSVEGTPQYLLPLRRPEGAPNPWVLMARQRGDTTALHYYTLGEVSEEPTARGLEYVRWLVNLINQHLRGRSVGGVRIDAATPNWFSAAAQGHELSGGPAAPPLPVPDPTAPDYPFDFDDATLKRLGEDQQPGVVVAILDTSPSAEDVQAAAARFPGNALLQRVAARVSIAGASSLPPTYFSPLNPFVTHLQGQAGKGGSGGSGQEQFAMPDHGLFGAGIVYDIAWAAEIHLIRVLGDTGVGDLLALTHALSQLPALLLSGENAGKRLIVNLSLMLDIPPSEHLLSLWFPRTSASLPALRRRWSDVCRTLTLLQSSIVEVIDWLGEQGALVVAAAGNDNLGATVRPEPRLPARHESVLSVAAVDMTRQPAGFSNRGDAPGFGNGLAVLGGNAALAGGGGPPQISRGGDGQPDAVVGIFSADELPLGAGKNETGWAYWVGTSFATPIISAIAARVWCVNPHLTPDEVKAAVHAFATSPESPLDCSAVIAWQQT